MKILDLHADIGCDVLFHHKRGMKNVLDTRHTEKLLKGEVSIVGMASFFDGHESWEEMQEMILTLENELKESKTWQRVLDKEDLISDKPKAIMTVEGMCGIQEDVEEKVQWMYDHGIRIASLCWNDENALATGVKGNPERGLTELGIRVLKKMEELKMIVDVSHANEKTFWDILDHTHGMIIATHSNAHALCPHPRNLKDDQIQAIAKRNGVIGMNACAYFVDEDLSKVNAKALAEHASYIKKLVGSEHLACGFDYMDFFEDHEASTICDLKDASESQHFIHALKETDFREEEIKKIAHQNVIERFVSYW